MNTEEYFETAKRSVTKASRSIHDAYKNGINKLKELKRKDYELETMLDALFESMQYIEEAESILYNLW